MNDQTDTATLGKAERAEQLPATDIATETDTKVARIVGGDTEVGTSFGGLNIKNMAEVVDMAKLMSRSGAAVPSHLRDNPGMCWAICLQSIEWKMSPFAVANKSYVTGDRLNYESQLMHAVIEARAPLQGRLKVRYEDEGDDRVCIVSGTFKGETEPREHRSPKLSEIRPAYKMDGGKPVLDSRGRPTVKGSPLWVAKPDVQMFYDTSRDFCRIYCPDVLLGIYTPDEIEQYGDSIASGARDVTEAAATLHQRLADAAQTSTGEGFGDGGDIDQNIDRARADHLPTDDGEVIDNKTGDTKQKEPAKAKAGKAAAKKKTETPIKAPTNQAEYSEYSRAWIDNAESVAGLNERWHNERQLRNACGLTAEDRQPIQTYAEEKVNLLLVARG